MSDTTQPSLPRRLMAEALGTGCLLMSIIGSGIMAANISGGNGGVVLMGIALPVGAVLAVLILMFAPISGAHFNPAVTLAVAAQGGMKWREVPAYIVTQVAAGIAGTVVANMMFDLSAVSLSTTARTGTGQWIGEFVATFGLFAVIWATARLRGTALPFAVASYVFAAIWFTSSTCFANPAVTIGRVFSDTACGIRPQDVVPFIAFQLLGAAAATAFFHWLVPADTAVPAEAPAPEEPAKQPAYSGPLTPSPD